MTGGSYGAIFDLVRSVCAREGIEEEFRAQIEEKIIRTFEDHIEVVDDYDEAAESERRFFQMADPAYQYDVRGFGDGPPEPCEW